MDHIPVLVDEVIDGLCIKNGGIYVDGTVGMGGHAEAILERHGEIGLLIGLDLDADAVLRASERLARFGEKIHLVCGNFSVLSDILVDMGIDKVDGMLLDLGMSSYQLEKSGKGFSFMKDEPLDMRMDNSFTITAADMVNELPACELETLIRTYGEERWAKRIAEAIVERRRSAPVVTSLDLARIVAGVVPRRVQGAKMHPATRTFQALRIAVNRELENLKEALDLLPSCLKIGGRLCVISFHSLEDRMVKDAFRSDSRLIRVTKRPIVASPVELAVNPRARSARLRIAERVDSQFLTNSCKKL
ncbi:MAG: 16S rRNA (cytosine(1402)-N(4))-methyltransferase RsmH [Dissulfurimicrobium sp.]|uniref:16S rRNA (cytosine(1402)-N(4))-methyltransferase RsmH n=1 Tax=Dissulfurimicrobium TaxID=1769732 RepID=UPI001EDC6B44|nr:16S rRNA (cytosine(1402)-N(4))-methyltransferase RsmH [Dissulfurimicrobium hydrothermale]UKL12881.1 16S rRNA (cytosine(1402)-N(4))-methyltransferase RsmH [Dissulfurimicrobium hydrothermale]